MKNLLTILKEKDKYEKMKENVKSISEKLEEKQENKQLNSVNSRTTSLWTCNLLKSIEHLHHYDDFYDYYDDFYEYYDNFYEYFDDFFLIKHSHHQKKKFLCVCIYKMLTYSIKT